MVNCSVSRNILALVNLRVELINEGITSLGLGEFKDSHNLLQVRGIVSVHIVFQDFIDLIMLSSSSFGVLLDVLNSSSNSRDTFKVFGDSVLFE